MKLVNFENRIFCRDNLKLLQQLPNECIDLIYCDVLYGTGIDFGEYQDIVADRKVVEDFYIPRITEMYKVLKPTGSIYLQMDYKISHWMRLILDEIFGVDNIVNEIIWTYGSGGTSNRWFAKKHDSIFLYVKNLNMYAFNSLKERKPGLFKNVLEDEKGKFVWFSRPSLKNPKGTKNYIDGYMRDVWFIPHLNQQSKERTGYSTQKPEELVERIIEASSNKGDLVADFFCGSGTTGAVCIRLDRKYLLCDSSKEALDVTKKRLATAKKRKPRFI